MSSDASLRIPKSSHQHTPRLPSEDLVGTTTLSRAVRWFRGENLSPNQRVERVARLTAAFATAVILSLTIVGIYFIRKAVIEWKKQDQLLKTKTKEAKEAVEAEKAKKAEEEGAKLKAQQKAAKKAELEAAKKIQLEEAKLKAQQEEARLKAQQLKELQAQQEAAKVTQEPVSLVEEKVQVSESTYPAPYETLKKMNLYEPGDLETVLQKANKALKKGNGHLVPKSYADLENEIDSEDQLKQLFDEAKVITHHICMKEYGSDKPSNNDYKKFMITNIDMLMKYLYDTKKFPDDPFAWADV